MESIIRDEIFEPRVFTTGDIQKYLGFGRKELADLGELNYNTIKNNKKYRELDSFYQIISMLCDLVANDPKKTKAWMETNRPQFMHMTPRELILKDEDGVNMVIKFLRAYLDPQSGIYSGD